jgi:hypothetical protein
MSGEKIFLSREEQAFLMEMTDTKSPSDAVEKFAILMVEERVDPSDLEDYLKKIMKVDLEEYFIKLKKRGK